MIAELSLFCLSLALIISLVQAALPLVGAHVQNGRLMALARPCACAVFVLVALSFAGLMQAFIVSDFSVKTVYSNSHTAKPILYKIAGVWGNHEGSMLLWILMLTFLGAMVALFDSRLTQTFRARVLGVQGVIGSAFLSFSLLTSNPFSRLNPVPLDGRDLNPLLQDPGLAYHPPFLYFGYVGFSIAFAFAVAALLEGRVDTRWARWVRPWTLLAWSSLTLGIAMGAWWAYYELGWGGFWFWDPVENASLMPWLAGTALVHSAIVVEKRDSLKVWTVMMAIIAFSTSLMGTFLVRSGLLTSVHAFANDPLRGQFLLLIFSVLTGAALLIFALRAGRIQSGGHFAMLSRESALIVNNVILSIILAVVMLGTFWPAFSDMIFNRTVSVGPPYFNLVAIPLTFILVIFMAAGIFAPWKRASGEAIVKRLGLMALITIAFVLLVQWLRIGGPVLGVVGAFMGAWVIISIVMDIALRIGVPKLPLKQSFNRLVHLPSTFWGGALAHLGVGIVLLGMTGTAVWVSENSAVMKPGDRLEIAGYELQFDGMARRNVANYQTETGTFTLFRGDKMIAVIEPERRFYPVAGMTTTEAEFVPRFASDIYVALGEPRDDGGQVVLAWHHPLVFFMWGGALIMTLGGIIAVRQRNRPQRVLTQTGDELAKVGV